MRRADRQVLPIRPTVVSARDRYRIPARPFPVNVNEIIGGADLETVAVVRPEIHSVIGGVLSVALELTLMLPRPMLERIVARLIERLDELDGDSDLEPTDEREPDEGV